MNDGERLEKWIGAGLFDPDIANADALRAVLEFYDSIGVNPAEFVDVLPEDLISTISNSFLRPGRRFSAHEVREVTGLTENSFRELCRTAGYSIDGEFTETDIAGFQSFALARSLFSEDALLEFSRTLGTSMAKVADATSALFRVDIAPQVEASGGADAEYARLNHQTAELIDVIYAPMKAFFLHQLIGAIKLSDLGRQAVTSSATTTIKVAVAFVDIVGYTRFAGSVDPDELAQFIRKFESQAIQLVSEHGGRLVKMIGDEVMFVAVDPGAALAAAAAIVESFKGTNSSPRAGVAYGEVVALGGDYYGEVVNLASRVTDQAVPGEVLVDATTAKAAPDLLFEPAGRRQLKGFDEPVPLMTLVRE